MGVFPPPRFNYFVQLFSHCVHENCGVSWNHSRFLNEKVCSSGQASVRVCPLPIWNVPRTGTLCCIPGYPLGWEDGELSNVPQCNLGFHIWCSGVPQQTNQCRQDFGKKGSWKITYLNVSCKWLTLWNKWNMCEFTHSICYCFFLWSVLWMRTAESCLHVLSVWHQFPTLAPYLCSCFSLVLKHMTVSFFHWCLL